MIMNYDALFSKYAKKWQFNDGLRGVIGSYCLTLSNCKYKLVVLVSDRRYFDGRKTKDVFSCYDAIEMDRYLSDNEPETK